MTEETPEPATELTLADIKAIAAQQGASVSANDRGYTQGPVLLVCARVGDPTVVKERVGGLAHCSECDTLVYVAKASESMLEAGMCTVVCDVCSPVTIEIVDLSTPEHWDPLPWAGDPGYRAAVSTAIEAITTSRVSALNPFISVYAAFGIAKHCDDLYREGHPELAVTSIQSGTAVFHQVNHDIGAERVAAFRHLEQRVYNTVYPTGIFDSTNLVYRSLLTDYVTKMLANDPTAAVTIYGQVNAVAVCLTELASDVPLDMPGMAAAVRDQITADFSTLMKLALETDEPAPSPATPPDHHRPDDTAPSNDGGS